MNSERTPEEIKEQFIGWAQETLRLCFTVHSRETAASSASRKGAPTEALALAHELWDQATAECGVDPLADLVALAGAQKVLDWCAAFRVSAT